MKCGCKFLWMSTDLPFCTIRQRVTCAKPTVRMSKIAGDTNAECSHCMPKCKRTEYSVSQTSSPISKYSAGLFYMTSTVPEYITKIARIQDWVYLEARNTSYIDEIYKLGIVAKGIPKRFEEQLDRLDHFSNETKVRSQYDDIQSAVWDLKQKHLNLTQAVQSSFFYEFMENMQQPMSDDYIPDDIFLRCANDILRHNGTHMKRLYLTVSTQLNAILSLLDALHSKINTSNTSTLPGIYTPNQNETGLVMSHVLLDINRLFQDYKNLEKDFDNIYKKYQAIHTLVQMDSVLLNTYDWGLNRYEEFYQQNYVELNIYFESLSTTKVEQLETPGGPLLQIVLPCVSENSQKRVLFSE